MTGEELKALRLLARMSRATVASVSGLHPDTVRYWEQKNKVDLLGWGPSRILRALGWGKLPWHPAYQIEGQSGYFRTPTRAWDGVLVGKPAECGALTRKGTPCRCKPLPGKCRCKFHGGASTGPKTIEGRQRIADAQRRRWARWRGDGDH